MQRSYPSYALAVALACLIVGCAPEAESEADRAAGNEFEPNGEVLFSESPAMWFDAYSTWLHVSPDGERAVFDYSRLIDLRSGVELEMPGGLDRVFRARFDADGSLMVAGLRGDAQGWFRPEADFAAPDSAPRDETLPPSYILEPSPSGEDFAYWSSDDPNTLLIAGRTEPGSPASTSRAFPVPAPIAGLAWLPHGNGIVAASIDEAGVGTLHLVDLSTGTVATVAEGLDGSSLGTRIAVSDDGRVAYLALAGHDAPDPDARHLPYADRDLDIWEVDLTSGERRPVVEGPGEQMVPVYAAKTLHWVSVSSRYEVALLPMPTGSVDGRGMAGPPQVVASGAQLGTWRPDGGALGVTTGDWRVADWALNLDGGVIEIDGNGRPTGTIEAIITGYHEDFSPVWSPDGRWIAYHSHRSDAPVAGYTADGSTDDIYLRRVDAPDAEEIRLTDFGWEVGNPDWSADGRRLVMNTWNQGGGSTTWIVELDPETGSFLGRTPVPQPESAIGGPVWAAWSPVADELAVTYADQARTELWLTAPDGSGARRLAEWEGGRYGGLDWSADGRTLVYAAPVEGRFRLYAVSRDGGESWLLAEDEANLLHPQVSPDGRWVAVTRLHHERRIMREER